MHDNKRLLSFFNNDIIRTFMLIVCCSLFVFAHAQNPVNESARSGGLINEDYKDYWANGQLRVSYTLKNGNLEGEYLEYYQSGKLLSVSYFNGGHFNGINKTYNEQGQILVEEEFANDTLLFYRETRYYKSGNVQIIREMVCDRDSLKLCPFVKAKVRGNRITYDMNRTAEKLKSHGKCYEYYENGTLKTEDSLVNNRMEGVSKWYYENGKIAGEGTYHQDKANGIFIYYSKTGEVERREKWQNGKRVKEK